MIYLPFPLIPWAVSLTAVDEFLEERNPPRNRHEQHNDQARDHETHKFAAHSCASYLIGLGVCNALKTPLATAATSKV